MSGDNDSDSDILADSRKHRKQLYEQLSASPVVNLTGAIGSSGPSGFKLQGDSLWELSFDMIAWKVGSGSIRRESLHIRMKVAGSDLDHYQDMIDAETIVTISGRLLEENSMGKPQFLMEDYLGIDDSDAELQKQLDEYRKPIIYEDNELGCFTYDRKLNWFTGQMYWNAISIEINLIPDKPSDIDDPLSTARALWNDQVRWGQRIQRYAADRLLVDKNDGWLEEGEADLSADQFIDCLSLESVMVYTGGRFEFYFDDEGLFWGHQILVTGSLSEGTGDASIVG